jgi:Tfp pilus assembly protein PilF
MKDAEANLMKAVEAKPDFALAHFWLGMVSFNQNKKAMAKEHLQKYLELDPSGSEAATAKEILPLLK